MAQNASWSREKIPGVTEKQRNDQKNTPMTQLNSRGERTHRGKNLEHMRKHRHHQLRDSGADS